MTIEEQALSNVELADFSDDSGLLQVGQELTANEKATSSL
jgi:hypothetical protein